MRFITFACFLIMALALPVSADAAKKAKKNKNKVKVDKTATPADYIGMHPYFALENIAPKGGGDLKIGGMWFDGDILYVTALSPDRTNKKPDHAGKVLRLENVIEADGKGASVKVTTLCDWLYEPCAIAVVGGSIYVGEKDRIIRFDNGVNRDSFVKGEETVLVDGTSEINFHTYTVGFEPYEKDGDLFLCANFTTAILLGGRRAVMDPPNPKVHRGSTFILGPVTGNESPDSLTIDYLAGGFRTPNGIEVGPDQDVWVADNQGIFNPSNELVRIEPGSFYGHYLLTKKGKAAAFQPTDIDSVAGSSSGQSPATVYLPQGVVARSPAQPIVLREEDGLLAPYKGQILLCEFTSGRLLRVFTEEVDGVWQGVVFPHSGGPADENGANGFTAGPNRIEQGPDGHYYIGQIGAGNLWTYNQTNSGLQRLRVKAPAEVSSDFNEILAVRVVDGGFELEFLKPVASDSISSEEIEITQWTYFPTSSYGGSNQGTIKLKPQSLSFDATGKKATLVINGLKDGSPEYLINDKSGKPGNENTGWVVHVKFDPKIDNRSLLYTNEFWYTLHKKIGGKEAGENDTIELTKQEEAEQRYQSLCIACHVERDGGWAAPKLSGILGREQTVIRDGVEAKVKIDREYLMNAILNPDSERNLQYKDVVMPPLGLTPELASEMVDYILGLE